jgi:hypothetical protein
MCVALLRLGFTCGQGRKAFRRSHPCDIFPLARRPSFLEEDVDLTQGVPLLFGADALYPGATRPIVAGGDTDSADCAWYAFGPGRGGHYEVIEVGEPLQGTAARKEGRAR